MGDFLTILGCIWTNFGLILNVGAVRCGGVESYSGGQADGQTGGQVDRWTGGQVDRWTGRQADKWTGGQADRWTGGQVDKWTGGHSQFYFYYTFKQKCAIPDDIRHSH